MKFIDKQFRVAAYPELVPDALSAQDRERAWFTDDKLEVAPVEYDGADDPHIEIIGCRSDNIGIEELKKHVWRKRYQLTEPDVDTPLDVIGGYVVVEARHILNGKPWTDWTKVSKIDPVRIPGMFDEDIE
ncbi:MAG TPA: hypothetical protein VF572_06955 [Candidatus Saccharimonadales bacterium]